MGTNAIYLLVVISTFFWGANFVLAGAVMADLPALWAAALRFLLGAAIMWVLTRGRGETLAAPGRQHGWSYAVLGVVGVGGFNLLFFFALQHTSADNAALIMATNPLLTTLLAALLLGERPTRRQLAAIPLALAGVAVVISGGDPQRLAHLHINAGDLLMVGADLTWAFYNVLSRRFMPGGSAVVNTTWIMTAGAALLLAVALASGENVGVPGARAGMALAGMAVGGTVLAYLFWNMGIARLGAGRTALFLNLVPVFAMLVGAAVGTAPTPAQMVGGLLVIGGVSIAMLPRRRLVPA